MKIANLIESTMSAGPDDNALEVALRRSRERLDRALARIRRPEAAVGIVDSGLGRMLVAASERGVAMTHFIDDESGLAASLTRLRLVFDPIEDAGAVRDIGAELRGHLGGESDALRHHPDMRLAGDNFQRKALERLMAVPRGAVISYQALAAIAGAPGGARAAGNAMHVNPIPIYVPCHRVICADGRIGNYGGGVGRKLALLRAEGFALAGAAARLPEGFVWGHRGTRIYCNPECRTALRVNRSRILVFADSHHAREAGMRACRICRPE
jgi:O-6-methylguanine DNA methyltransferase